MAKIAVIILTLNEERHIADCIRSAAFSDEVLLVDSGSTDETIPLARALGARVAQHPMEGFAAQRNFALKETAVDWVFYLDADERLTPAAGEAIRRLAEGGERAAYEICRHNIVFGTPMHYGAHRPDWSLRLFPRDAVVWEGVVHERAVVSVPIRRMPGEMLHYTYDTWATYLTKFNRYTTLAAEKLFAEGRRANAVTLLFHPPFMFFKMYVLKLGFLDGFLGFAMSVMAGLSVFMKYLKLAELSRQKGV
ncbi:MAG: glycosyltransferase family 2 protein [Schwartzia sp. (in: firmicutes)]